MSDRERRMEKYLELMAGETFAQGDILVERCVKVARSRVEMIDRNKGWLFDRLEP